MSPSPPTDLEEVVNNEIKEWHFHIYFLQNNPAQHHAAIELRDAVLRLRRDGAFVAVPLFRVYTDPMGPHPIGVTSGESTSGTLVFVDLPTKRQSVLVHPLTREEKRDHQTRQAWIGRSLPLDLTNLPILSDEIPLQYPRLKLGYSAPKPDYTLEERRQIGANVEQILRGEKEAARTPLD